MSEPLREFGNTARTLSRNPLGIIALFIVLVYGLASLVTLFGGSLSAADRRPLIYFMVIFPVLVLSVFTWLVTRHSPKLFSPSDFKNEDNYVRMLSAAASLAVASAKSAPETSDTEIRAVVESVQSSSAGRVELGPYWRRHVLWVDDRPHNNVNERRAFEAMGIRFTLAESTTDALQSLSKQRFAAIISDMGRREGPREGYALLDALRADNNQTPFFIYAGSASTEHREESAVHGAQGCTNMPQELFRMVMRATADR